MSTSVRERRPNAGYRAERSGAAERAVTVAPRVDVLETEHEFLVLADLPGVKPEDVDIRFEKGELTVHGRRPAAPRVRAAGRAYHRTFAVAETVAADRIGADLKARRADGAAAEGRGGQAEEDRRDGLNREQCDVSLLAAMRTGRARCTLASLLRRVVRERVGDAPLHLFARLQVDRQVRLRADRRLDAPHVELRERVAVLHRRPRRRSGRGASRTRGAPRPSASKPGQARPSRTPSAACP